MDEMDKKRKLVPAHVEMMGYLGMGNNPEKQPNLT